jgi:hypothetical protein
MSLRPNFNPPPLARPRTLAGARISLPRSGAELRRCLRISHLVGQALRVDVVFADGTKRTGVCEDSSWTGVGVRFAAAADPGLHAGESGVLSFRAHSLHDLSVRARVVTVRPLDCGGVRYGFAFDHEEDLRQQATPEWARWFSRRRHLRLKVERAQAVLRWPRGEVPARVVDLSVAGAGVEIGLEVAHALVAARTVQVTLLVPGFQNPLRLSARVRGAVQGARTVRVGLEFVQDEAYARCRGELQAWSERYGVRHPFPHLLERIRPI